MEKFLQRDPINRIQDFILNLLCIEYLHANPYNSKRFWKKLREKTISSIPTFTIFDTITFKPYGAGILFGFLRYSISMK